MEHIDAVVEEIGRRFAGLDIVVNNAAINPPTAILDVAEAGCHCVMAVNAKGPFFVMQRASRVLRDGGRIIASHRSARRSRHRVPPST